MGMAYLGWRARGELSGSTWSAQAPSGRDGERRDSWVGLTAILSGNAAQ